MDPKLATRRRHSAELREKVLAACAEPGASVAAVALANDLNANLVHKWRRCRDARLSPSTDMTAAQAVAVSLPPAPTTGSVAGRVAVTAQQAVAASMLTEAAAAFVPVRLEVPRAAQADIRLELLAGPGRSGVWQLAARVARMIRIDAMWLAVEAVDMRAGVDRLLARVVQGRGHPLAHAGNQRADPEPARKPSPRCPADRFHHVRHERDGPGPSASAQDATPRRLQCARPFDVCYAAGISGCAPSMSSAGGASTTETSQRKTTEVP